jgi:hypothetical protein
MSIGGWDFALYDIDVFDGDGRFTLAGISVFTAGDISYIHATGQDLAATNEALFGIPIVFYRADVTTGEYVARQSQIVAVTLANRESRDIAEQGAQSTYADGELMKQVPFDVRVGDAFDLPDGRPATVTLVPFAHNSIQRAKFTFDGGNGG